MAVDFNLIIMGVVGTAIVLFWVVWAMRMLEATERIRELMEFITDRIEEEIQE